MTLTILVFRRARCKRWHGERGRFPSAHCDIPGRAEKSQVRDISCSLSSHNTSCAQSATSTQLATTWPRWWSHATSARARARGPRFNAAILPKRPRQSTRCRCAAAALGYRRLEETLTEDLRRRAGEAPTRHGDRQCSRARDGAPDRAHEPRSATTARRVPALRLGATRRKEWTMRALRKDSQCQL